MEESAPTREENAPNGEQNLDNGLVLKPILGSHAHYDQDQDQDQDLELDTKKKEVTAESEIEDIIPGSKDDPFRTFRWLKQICLVLVWICIVSIQFYLIPFRNAFHQFSSIKCKLICLRNNYIIWFTLIYSINSYD